MSDVATVWAWKQDVESDKVRLTLLLIANCSDLSGAVSASRKEWAALLRCSTDTFDRRVRTLVDANLLKVERTKTKRGFGASVYRLQINEEVRVEPSRNSAATPKTAASRKSAASKPETIRAPSEAAELPLAATVAASIKKPTSSTESYPDRPVLVLESGDAPRSARRRPTSKTPVDPSMAYGQMLREYAAERGFLNGCGEALFERFIDHHLAKGSLMADWGAAWRNWVRNEIKFNGEPNGQRSGASARSGGNGRRARSVESEILMRDILEGREGEQRGLDPRTIA